MRIVFRLGEIKTQFCPDEETLLSHVRVEAHMLHSWAASQTNQSGRIIGDDPKTFRALQPYERQKQPNPCMACGGICKEIAELWTTQAL